MNPQLSKLGQSPAASCCYRSVLRCIINTCNLTRSRSPKIKPVLEGLRKTMIDLRSGKAAEPTRRHKQAAMSCWLGTSAAFLACLGVCLRGGHSGTGPSSTPVFRFDTVSFIPPILHTHNSLFYQRRNTAFSIFVSHNKRVHKFS
jgi:hypothetical protein